MHCVKAHNHTAKLPPNHTQFWSLMPFFSFFLNVTIFDSWIIQFDQVWSILDRNETAIFNLFISVTIVYSNIFWLLRNPIWSSLIKFGRIWSKKIQNKMATFILFKNVTTYYTNIFWYVQPLGSYPIWSSLIKFDPFWTDLIQTNKS